MSSPYSLGVRLASLDPQQPILSRRGDGNASAQVKRRASIACTRCRGLRSKCVHDSDLSRPCNACDAAGIKECLFPSRGEFNHAREYRHPRLRANKRHKSETPRSRRESTAANNDHHHPFRSVQCHGGLAPVPDIDLIREGLISYTRCLRQVRVIPQTQFLGQLEQNPESVSPFLLSSILSISARFHDELETKYGSRENALNRTLSNAEQIALSELYQPPTLGRCQAFLLLAIAQQESGKTRSAYINLGVAIRIAILMRLHREDTYRKVTADSTPEEIIRAESARRTLWMLYYYDHLHTGPYKSSSLALSDVSALLPCDEVEFENGIFPRCRAALQGTPPAQENPHLVSLEGRSIPAIFFQTFHLWTLVARRAASREKSLYPGDPNSDYAKIAAQLNAFEEKLPQKLRNLDSQPPKLFWSNDTDSVYVDSMMKMKLANIVLRKEYMNEMIHALDPVPSDPSTQFYQDMANKLFGNVRQLFGHIQMQWRDDEFFHNCCSQVTIFGIYTCGVFGLYLHRFPQFDPTIPYQNVQFEGTRMFEDACTLLDQGQRACPFACDLLDSLTEQFDDISKDVEFDSSLVTVSGEPQTCVLSSPLSSISSCQQPTMEAIRRYPYVSLSTPPYPGERQQLTLLDGLEPVQLPPLHSLSVYNDQRSLAPLSPVVGDFPELSGRGPSGNRVQRQQLHGSRRAERVDHTVKHQNTVVRAIPRPCMSDDLSRSLDEKYDVQLRRLLGLHWNTPDMPAASYMD